MAIFSDQYLLRLYQEAEEHISKEIPDLIFDRFTLAVQRNVAYYDLPSQIQGITRITWKTFPVNPAVPKELENVLNFRPNNLGTMNRPYLYIRLGYGNKAIKFFPNPPEDILADDTDVWSDDCFRTRVVVSCYRLADANSNFHIPAYVFRRMAKYYVLKEAYAKEGKGQDLLAAKYYEKRFDFWVERLRVIVNRIPEAVVKHLSGNIEGIVSIRPPRPRLPLNFGTIVE